MKQFITVSVLILAGLVLFSMLVNAQDEKAQYVGSSKCKICHMSAKQGAQYKKWQDSAHSKAYETLASEESKKVAEKVGVKGDPQKAAECLTCHVTAYNAPASEKAESFSMTEGVGCEECHGPGSLYKSMSIMKALRAGTQDPKAVAFQKDGKETCLQCHNEKSPTYKPFNFEERWAEA